LVNYTQYETYLKKLAQESGRLTVLSIGKSSEGRTMYAGIGAPPTRPYDNTGWTLAYTMGVTFDRILDGFACPCRTLPVEEIKPAAGKITGSMAPAGYLLSHELNDSFVAVNRLLNSGEEVYWIKDAFTANGKKWPAGTHFIPALASTLPKLQTLS